MGSSFMPIKQIVSGFISVFSGFHLIVSEKGFRRFIVFPFFLNIILLSAGIYTAIVYLFPGLYSLIPDYHNIFVDILRFIAKPLFACVILFFTILVYSFSGTIMCAPFLDFVSAKTEKYLTGSDGTTGTGLLSFMRSIFVTFRNTIGLLLLFLVFNILLFIINFIPVMGSIVYGFISSMSLMLFIGYQFYDLNVERHGLPFGSKFEIMWKNKWSCIGIGFAFMIMTYIPIIGFLSTVAASSGAAMIYCKKESR